MGEPGITDGFSELQLRMAKAFFLSVLSAPCLPGEAVRCLLAMPSWMTKRQTSLNIVVQRNPKTGEYRFPGRADAPCPPGFTPVHVDSVQKARKVEADIRKQDQQKAAEFAYRKLAQKDHMLSRNANDLREALRTGEYEIPDPSDLTGQRKKKIKGITPQGRELIAAGLDHIEEARKEGVKIIEPDVGFEALSYDRSNREPYRDAATNWKAVKD